LAEDTEQPNTLELATELTIAWLSNSNTAASADDVPAFLQKVHSALNSMASPQAATEQPVEQEYTPAVTVRKSLASKDHIISLIDGKPYKAMRRHLSGHGLTPDQYRQRYGLKPDYPMVSEGYSQVRRDMAKKIGLGRKPGTKVAPVPNNVAAPKATAPKAAAPNAAPKPAASKAAAPKAAATKAAASTAASANAAAPAKRGRKPKAQ
jgi:predicted transcriptional regulator